MFLNSSAGCAVYTADGGCYLLSAFQPYCLSQTYCTNDIFFHSLKRKSTL